MSDLIVNQLISQRLVSELTSDDEGIVVPKINNDIIQDLPKAPKAKRVESEKTKEALKLGREKLAEKWKVDKVKNEELK